MNANEPISPASNHEPRDVDVISLVLVAALFLICGLIVFFACAGLVHAFNEKDKTRPTELASTELSHAEFPQPRLQVKPGVDLKTLRAEEERELSSYGWVNRSAGVVRIPIDRAMDLIMQRGLPEVGANKTPLQLTQQRSQPGETPAATPNTAQ
jgi:hypothetical protein